MSISPTDAQRYVSNPSSRDSEQNPSSGHGLFPSQHDGCPFGRRTNESASISAGSAQDSSTGPPDGRPVEISRPNHGSFEDTTGASKNVRELKSSNARKHSSGKNSSTYPRHQSFGQSSSSQFRSNKLEMQPNGRLAATVNMLHSDHWPLDSSDIQFTTTQASRRRDFLNANHLLNFHYDSIPRPRQPQRTHLPRRQQRVKPYNKDLFLQANYKFIIYDSGSYSLESIDPDKMFPWEDVVCVRYSSPFPAQCPICLESPLCPQITSCGHIFCFPCILRYLLMGVEEHKGESWKKCPLCFSMISSKDLYTIKIDDVKQFRVGDHVDFLLLARAKDSQIPLLKSQGDAGVMPTNYDNASDLFSKFILSSDVELSVRDAKIGLTNWLCKAETGTIDDLEKLPYVCAALEELEERMRKWTEDRIFNENSPQFNRFALSSSRKVRHHHPNSSNPCPLNSNLETEHAHSKAWMVKSLENGQIHEMSEFSEKASDGSHPKTTVGSSEFLHEEVLQKDSNSCIKFRERDSYTFYQAIDGQALILHPLCMKCLLHHYGSYDMLPPRISGVILELEIITQSEAMRKRYRYLSHFSLSTTFQLCEIDLAEILPFASLAPFMGEIKKREKQRKKLAKKERDEKIRVEATNCAEVASLREMLNPTNQRYLSDKDTIFSLDEFEALGSGVAPATNPSMNTTTTKLFSNVTRLGYAAAYDSPALRAVELANSSGIMDATQEASGSHGPSTAAIPSSYASILSSSTKSESEGGPEMHNSNGNGITRKGKKPNRVLLSTAGGRRY